MVSSRSRLHYDVPPWDESVKLQHDFLRKIVNIVSTEPVRYEKETERKRLTDCVQNKHDKED